MYSDREMAHLMTHEEIDASVIAEIIEAVRYFETDIECPYFAVNAHRCRRTARLRLQFTYTPADSVENVGLCG